MNAGTACKSPTWVTRSTRRTRRTVWRPCARPPRAAATSTHHRPRATLPSTKRAAETETADGTTSSRRRRPGAARPYCPTLRDANPPFTDCPAAAIPVWDDALTSPAPPRRRPITRAAPAPDWTTAPAPTPAPTPPCDHLFCDTVARIFVDE